MVSPELVFLQDLAVVAGVAAATSLLFQRIRFPLVFGLLAAGVIIGPHTPPISFIQDEESLQVLANLGVVLLLFGLGLEFDLRGLRRFGVAAAAITVAEVLLMFWVGYEAGRLLGWGPTDAAFLGAMLSISSTAIIVAVLREMGKMEAESSRLLFAVLVLEDVAAILILVLLSGYAATGGLPFREAALVLARMTIFLLAFLLLGLLVVPRLIDWIVKHYRQEVLVLAVLGLALMGAILSDLAGFHVGLGAFLVGALCAEARQKSVLEERFRPVHDLFAAIFFVAIGTLVDFALLAQYWRAVAVITIAIIVGKTIAGGFTSFLVGFAPRPSFAVGLALGQIGEFSFVIAALGISTGVMDPALFPIIVGAAAVTSFTSPVLIRYAEPLSERLGRLVPLSLRTYASVYGSYIQGWRDRPRAEQPAAVQAARRHTIASGVLLLLAMGGALLFSGSGTRLLARQGFDARLAILLYWTMWLVVVIPSLIEFNRQLRRWMDAYDKARPLRTEGLGVRTVVRSTVYFGLSLLIGLPVLFVTGPLLGGPTAAILWAVVVTAASLVLLRGIRQLHRRVSENLGRLLEEKEAPISAPDALERLLTAELPLQFNLERIPLNDNSIWTERRLADTDLRRTTGASIILVERADGRQLVPQPDTLLLARDRLLVVGAAPEIKAARQLLNEPKAAGARVNLHPGRLVVLEGSPLDGRPLVESRLRDRYGVQVVAIQRGKDIVANPLPEERLTAGDILLVLGTQQQIFAATEALRAPGPTAPS